ncbi:arylsulfatase J-like isoform X2 [Sycon ciliatum]|uniref:arylsulfatase J-like isoform X2 n=1 Tax=Sycon ciliatum TaxID=27933 RepID=UPI0031F6F9BF
MACERLNFVLFVVAVFGHGVTLAASPPHILFVAADDLGWNDVGFHGNDAIKTPNLDALAHEGVILNHTYVQPVCSPTRSCFMSGRFPFHTGLQHSVIQPERAYGLNLSITTTAQQLKSLGYSTHIIGKWHLGFCNKEYTPTQRGFDSFFGYYLGAEDYYTHRRSGSVPSNSQNKNVNIDGLDFHRDTADSYSNVVNDNGTYSAYAFAAEAINIAKGHNATSGPLYLYLPFQSVHGPLQAPQRFVDMYSHIKDKKRRTFSAMVTAMDEAIGNITQTYKDQGLWENTMMIFTTDNGGPTTVGANNWPLRGGKHTVWEGGTRGSAFIHGFMLNKTGYTYNGVTHSVDWYPTVVSIAGGKVDVSDIDGLDVWPALQNNLTSPRTGFVYNIDKTGNVSAIRVGQYKYITGIPGSPSGWYPPPGDDVFLDNDGMEADSGAKPDKGPWLFDVDVDPLEKNNLYSTMPDQVKVMEAQLAEYMEGYVDDLYSKHPPDPKCNPALYDGAWSPGWC